MAESEKGKKRRCDVRLSEHKKILRKYKYLLRKAKEEKWGQYVSVYSNLDPLGVVYSVCRGKNVRECLTSWSVNDTGYVA
ncbi:hypothetical protein WN51_06537 [Melipona quadrifasciata]|uniref:Uncharacterized protein n=1 Tax=Melipona quadrifasciata TaxID=166423 RepID=A0A0M8ZRL1_9HYME|nr:hypothetical protein WN51_06537 [Melipona quadrifasciata]